MIRNVPDGWRIEKLGNSFVAKIIMGQSPASSSYNSNKDGLPFYQGKKDFGKKYPIAREYSNEPKKIAIQDDILFCVRAPVGITNIATEKCCIGRGLSAIRANKLNCLSDFLRYFFIKNEKRISDRGRGSTFVSINKKDLEELEIQIPPLQQQEKIVKVLDISSQLIEKQKELIQNYDLFLKSKFIEMFGDPIRNPMGWKVEKFSKLANIKTTSIQSDKITNEIYIALDSIEKETGKLVEAYSSEEVDIKSNKYIFTSSMLLYGKLRPYLNKVLLPNFDGICSTDILPIEPISDITTKQYIAYYLRNSKVVELLSNSVSGANLPRVSPKILKDLNIQRIPIELQNKFASIVEKIETIKSQEIQKLEHLETLHSSLMDKAFKGEIQ